MFEAKQHCFGHAPLEPRVGLLYQYLKIGGDWCVWPTVTNGLHLSWATQAILVEHPNIHHLSLSLSLSHTGSKFWLSTSLNSLLSGFRLRWKEALLVAAWFQADFGLAFGSQLCFLPLASLVVSTVTGTGLDGFSVVQCSASPFLPHCLSTCVLSITETTLSTHFCVYLVMIFTSELGTYVG